MIGAMLVSLVVIGGFILFRAVVRDDVEVKPQAVDYRAVVRSVQDSGDQVVYPRSLPRGWKMTSVDVTSEGDPVWGLSGVTDESHFVGLRLEDAPVEDLVDTYVDEKADRGATGPAAPGAVVKRWQQWSDEGGDTAYSAVVDGRTLLVYGSRSEDVWEFANGLTMAEVK